MSAAPDRPLRVLVTGGTSGIGLATALAFAATGARCAVTYRWGSVDEAEVRARFREVGASGPLLVQADVGQDDDTPALMSALGAEFDGIDVLVSNASTALVVRSPEDWSWRGFQKSLRSSAWPLAEYTFALKEQFGGYPRYVVGISSDGPDYFSVGYDFVAASKAAMEAMVRYLAYRLRDEGVRINAVRSRSVRTPAFEATFGADLVEFAGRFGTERHFIAPEEVAGVVVAVCSGQLDAVNGQVLTVDRGTAFSDNLMRLFEERSCLPL